METYLLTFYMQEQMLFKKINHISCLIHIHSKALKQTLLMEVYMGR